MNDKFTFMIERPRVTLSQIVIQSAKVMIEVYYSIWLVELLDRICEEANTEAGLKNQKGTSRAEIWVLIENESSKSTEIEIGEQGSNSSLASCVYFHTNTFENCMNLPLLFPPIYVLNWAL